MDDLTIYHALIASGMRQGAACQIMMRDHGLTAAQAAALAWLSAGQRQPTTSRDHAAWEHGHYAHRCGE